MTVSAPLSPYAQLCQTRDALRRELAEARQQLEAWRVSSLAAHDREAKLKEALRFADEAICEQWPAPGSPEIRALGIIRAALASPVEGDDKLGANSAPAEARCVPYLPVDEEVDRRVERVMASQPTTAEKHAGGGE